MFGMSVADTIRVVLMAIFILVCICLTVVVLMQESKQNGLSGAISGAADTYWGKNKGLDNETGYTGAKTNTLSVAANTLSAGSHYFYVKVTTMYEASWVAKKKSKSQRD